MYGAITSKDVFAQAPLIVREFGWRAYLRCLRGIFLSRKPVTFVDCVLAKEQ